MNYDQLAKEILSRVGGVENVNSVVHCITRLRFQLRDEGMAQTEELKKLSGVITVMQSGGQYQVVIGNEVPDVYKAITKLGNWSVEGEETLSSDENKTAKGNIFNRFIDMISGVFQPLLGLLVATGMIKGFNELFLSFGWITETSGTYQLLKATGDCLFYFFPVFLGYTAMKKFGGSSFIGMAIGASLVYPTLSSLSEGDPQFILFGGTIFESPIHITFLGLPVILMTYSSSVIPIILASFSASKLEKVLKELHHKWYERSWFPFLRCLSSSQLLFGNRAYIYMGRKFNWSGRY